MNFRHLCVSAVILGLCFCAAAKAAETKTPSPSSNTLSSPPATAATQQGRAVPDPHPAPPPPGDDVMMHNAAARTRMLECGHQWSAKKKNGTAIGTWKEFFKTCLPH